MIYPANKNALLFAEISGQKTLSSATLKRAESLGFSLLQVFENQSELN